LDEQFITPSFFQATFPECFMVSEKYFRPIMGALVKKRPMDNVRLDFDDAQEDEFALVKLIPDSPLLNVVFPLNAGYFVHNFQDFDPEKEINATSLKRMIEFYARVRGDSGKILLLKNPAHSLRIPFLCEIFPKAKFIYLHRHPYKVVASSLHLWKVLAKDNQLKGKPYYPNLQEVTEVLIKFYTVIERDLAALPEGRYCEVSYERMEADPVEEVKRIYHAFRLDFTPDFEGKVRSYLEMQKDFIKNSYYFSEDQKEQVFLMMKKQFEQYHYSVTG
jgi:hypothetical protein